MAEECGQPAYHTVTPYLIVEEPLPLIEFMTSVFDGKESERMTTPDGKIMHSEVKIGDSVVMLGQACEVAGLQLGMLYVMVADCDATYARAIAAGAISSQEPKDMFYGHRSAGVKHPSGTTWWFAHLIEQVSPEETQRRLEAAIAAQKGG